jgi:electron transfer flavoprotein alpha subunit
MSETPRIDPRRRGQTGPSGITRVALTAREVPAGDEPAKPLRTSAEPSRWLIAVTYADRGTIDDQGRQAVAAAAILANDADGVLAVVLGDASPDLADCGADAVIILPEFCAERFQPEPTLAALLAICKTYPPAHIFLLDHPRGEADLGRRLAFSLGASCAAHTVELSANHAAIAWAGGATLARTGLPKVILLEPGTVSLDLPFVGRNQPLSPTPYLADLTAPSAYRDFGLETAETSTLALDEADFVVSAGHGVQNTATLEALAQSLGAAVGASRVAVDEGKYPRDRQVGASGKTVSATTYIAVGISGAVQHLQGIKDCRHVIAINTDAAAPIVKRANLSIIGDADDIMQALTVRIGQARAQRERPET